MLKFLVPSFIKNIDKTLVLNYPFWYIVKLHYIVYFTALMWIVSYIIGCLLPIDISHYNPENATGIWIFVFSVLGVILFCVWMYYLTIYNNENHFGKYNRWDDTKLLLILMIGVNLIMSFSYPMQIRVKTRLGQTFSDTQLAKQYNQLNLAHKYINYDLTNYQYCGYAIHDIVSQEKLINDTDEYGQYRYQYDLNKYNNFVCFSPEGTDNYNYYFSDLFFSSSKYKPSSQFKQAFYNNTQIENEYSLHKNDAQKLSAIQHYFDVLKLYQNNRQSNYRDEMRANSYSYSPQDFLDNYNHYEKTCVSYFPDAYNLSTDDKMLQTHYLPINDVSSNILNVYKAKFSPIYLLKNSYLIFAFYFSFYIALIIIIFRNNRWQHFLVSVVSFILLGIIIGLFSLIVGFKSENLFFTLSMLTWVILASISINYYFKTDKYRVVGAIASTIFYVALPIIPLLFCVYFHEVFGWLKYDIGLYDASSIAQREIVERTYADAISLAQIIGIAGFILIAMPFYKLFFAKQKALPREQ